MLFLSSDSEEADKELTRRINENGYTVLFHYYDYVKRQLEEVETYEEFANGYQVSKLTDDEKKQRYEEYIKECDEKGGERNEAIAQGKYLKGFMIDGPDKSEWIYVELKKRAVPAKGSSTGNPAVDEILTEISRLEGKEKRSKELDAEKVFKAMFRNWES